MPSPQGVNSAPSALSVGPAAAPRLLLTTLAAFDPAPAVLLAPVARRLAALLALPLVDVPHPLDPPRALAALAGLEGPWLAALPVDVGLGLPGGCWAEDLGAWRQPTLLVLDGPQLLSGVPAAATALLERWQVPLVGLVQWGGAWEREARLREGLPWLGKLAPSGARAQGGQGGGGAGGQAQADGESEEQLLVALEGRRHRLCSQLA